MRHLTPRSVDLARWLVAAMVAVVVSFLSASLVAYERARTIDVSVGGIIDNAMPSVRELSAVRGALHRVDVDAERLALRGVASPSGIDAPRRAMNEALARYRELPLFEGEDRPRERALTAVGDVDRAVAALLEALEHRDTSLVDRALADERADAARADEALERLIDLNAVEGVRLGLRIRENRAATAERMLLLDGFSVVVALIATSLAITLMRRTVSTLEAATSSAERRVSVLEERSSELDQFAGRVAHDVLGPLSSSSLALEMVRRQVDDDALRAIVQRGISGLSRSRQLVEGLLELARTGAPPIAGARAPVATVLEDVVAAVRADADAAHVALVLEPTAALDVACVPGVLVSIASNLVRNAIKYIGDGPDRRVWVRARRDGTTCVVEVEDTGPGVPVGLERAIFEPFTRGRTDVPGAGLGLATVQRLALAHGGTIAYARTGQGTTLFACTLPLAAALAIDAPADAASA